ncbi:MAG: hypothetical protein JRF60_19510 [Deltaproteobacteria bacterium]|nr:hypothetical protein [Deltaproteobacteria bacterium]
MKNNVSKSKKKEVDTKKLIGIDQPFDYEEVVSITGPEYVQNLRRNGIAVLPYEELKENVPGFKLLDIKLRQNHASILNRGA